MGVVGGGVGLGGWGGGWVGGWVGLFGWGGLGSDVRWELLGTSSHDIMTLRYV